MKPVSIREIVVDQGELTVPQGREFDLDVSSVSHGESPLYIGSSGIIFGILQVRCGVP